MLYGDYLGWVGGGGGGEKVCSNVQCHMTKIATILISINGPRREKTCLGVCENTGADQPARLHRLIGAFVIPIFESIISKHATSEILIF